MVRSKTNLESRGRLLIFLLILICLGLTLYRTSFVTLISVVLHREGSSHGIFVPFLSGYLLFIKMDKIVEISPQVNVLPGLLALLIGMILFFLSIYTQYSLEFSILSYLLIFGGLVCLFFGSAIFQLTAFPLFFLATMIPIPPAIYSMIAEKMRLISTWGSVVVTRALGVPLYREDFNIYLSDANLFVGNGCSGIRYLLSYFVFSLVYAALFKKSISGRLVVVLGSIFLAILGGIIRLSTIFFAAHYISPVMAETKPHIFLSWTVFTVLLIGVITADQYIEGHKEQK